MWTIPVPPNPADESNTEKQVVGTVLAKEESLLGREGAFSLLDGVRPEAKLLFSAAVVFASCALLFHLG